MPVLNTAEDDANKAQVARVMERVWRCVMEPVADPYEVIDYKATRDGKVMSLVEVKCRKVPSTEYGSEWLNLPKYQSLMLERSLSGLPVMFVVGYEDRIIHWVEVGDIDGSDPQMRGRRPRDGVPNDIQPVLDVMHYVMHSVHMDEVA